MGSLLFQDVGSLEIIERLQSTDCVFNVLNVFMSLVDVDTLTKLNLVTWNQHFEYIVMSVIPRIQELHNFTDVPLAEIHGSSTRCSIQ